MFKLLCPDIYIKSIYDVDLQQLKDLNIKGVLVDLDNTILAWDQSEVSEDAIRWVDNLRQQGFMVCLVSNNRAKRIKQCAEQLKIPAVWGHFKPSRKAFRKGMKLLKTSSSETVVIGDQIFTDILGAKRLGLLAILVNPISSKELLWTKMVRSIEKRVLHILEKKKLLPNV